MMMSIHAGVLRGAARRRAVRGGGVPRGVGRPRGRRRARRLPPARRRGARSPGARRPRLTEGEPVTRRTVAHLATRARLAADN